MRRRYRVFGFTNIFAALYGGSMYIYLEFVGRFLLSEIFAVTVIFTVKFKRLLNDINELRNIIFGYTILFFSLVISDIYNDTPLTDFLRGIASIVFSLLSTIFLTGQFMKDWRSIAIFLLFLAGGAAMFIEGSLVSFIQEQNTNYFKVRFVPVLMPILILTTIFIWKRSQVLTIGLVFFCATFFAAMDSRAWALTLVISALLLAAQSLEFRPKTPQLLIASCIIVIVTYLVYVYYVNRVLNHDVGGSNAQQLLRAENPYNPLELLQEGRVQVFVTIEAIKERPLLGYGSWARDESGKFTFILAERKEQLDRLDKINEAGHIPTHSAVLTAWLWGGVGGLVGFLIVIWSMARLFVRGFWGSSPLVPAICILFVHGLWDAFFSPFGVLRTSFPYTLAILIAGVYSGQIVKRSGNHFPVSASNIRPKIRSRLPRYQKHIHDLRR